LLFFLVHMANWFCCFLYSNFIKYTLQCQYAILIFYTGVFWDLYELYSWYQFIHE
jgi:hypothetical protein